MNRKQCRFIAFAIGLALSWAAADTCFAPPRGAAPRIPSTGRSYSGSGRTTGGRYNERPYNERTHGETYREHTSGSSEHSASRPELKFNEFTARFSHERPAERELREKASEKLGSKPECHVFESKEYRPDSKLAEEKVTHRKQVGIVAFMPKSTEAYSKVFTPKGSKPIEPTAAQTKEAETITNELSHLDAHIIGSADQGVRAFENTLDGLRDNGVKLALIVGHSTTVLNGEDAGQRQVQLPDGTSLTLRQIHEAAVLRKMEAIVITCFSPDLSLQRLMAFREAVDSCHYAIEPLPETAAEAEPSHTTSTSSAPLELQSIVQRCHESLDGKSAWSNGVSMSFAAVLLGVANADGTGSQSSSQFVVTGLRRPSWRIWLSAAIALLGYTLVWRTMAAQYPTVAQRPTSVTKIKGHIAKRLHFMARFKTVAVIAAVIVGAIACWMLEWRDDRTEGVKSEINATRVAAYLSIAHASLSIGLIWLRPNISLIGKFLHGIAGAEIYPVITFAGDYRLVPITAVSSFALAFFLNWPVLLMVSLFAATIMAFITLGCVLVGFNLAARGKSPFIESPA